ncbi:MAG TPA: BrnA antitoxin family protein [Allosphingosinicella sp.]|nr:BrnA antitoxin family protein [Allosphingosinicella sp.]
MSNKVSSKASTEPPDRDEAPPLGKHFFATGALKAGDVTLRPATDTMARRGRPPQGSAAKIQQSLRLSPEVLDHFRGTGKGWQARIDATLAHIAELQRAIITGGELPARTPLERKMQLDMKRFNALIMGRTPNPPEGISAQFAEVHERISRAIAEMLGTSRPMPARELVSEAKAGTGRAAPLARRGRPPRKN